MHIPNIDLSEAAQSYGLTVVPKVVHTFDDEMEAMWMGSDPVAAWDPDDHQIHIFRSLFDPPTEYDQARFLKAGGKGRLQGSYDRVRFILAHELWHARQDEVMGDQFMRQNAMKVNGSFSTAVHDNDAVEHSADVHAVQVYTQIKIGD